MKQRLRHAIITLLILSASALNAELDIKVEQRSYAHHNTLYAPGSTVSFSASVYPARPGNYRWFHDNAQIIGAESPELSLPHLDGNDTGNYHAEFFDGNTTESSNTLTVNVVEFPNSPINRSFSAALPDFGFLTIPPLFFEDGRISLVYAPIHSPSRLVQLAPDGSILKLVQIPESANWVLDWLPDGGILTNGPPHRFHFDAEAAPLEIPEDFFFVHGRKIPPLVRHAVAHPDGKFYLTNGVDIRRFHADGSIDDTFQLQVPWQTASISELQLDHLGRLYVLGHRFHQWGERRHAYRLSEDGSLDPTFAEQFTNDFFGMSLFPLSDGRIIKEVSKHGNRELSLLDDTGIQNPNWNASRFSTSSISVDAERNLIYLSEGQEGWIWPRVRRYNLTSSGIEIDNSFYAGLTGNGPYHAPNGQLYTTGFFHEWEGHPTTGIALLHTVTEFPESTPPTVLLENIMPAGLGEEVRLKPRFLEQTETHTFEWLALDRQPLPAQKNSSELVLSGITLEHFGRYQLRVTNEYASILSNVVEVFPNTPIVSIRQPSPPPSEGAPYALQAEVTGLGPFTYQWIALEGQPLPSNTTSKDLVFPNFKKSQLGRYRLNVTGFGGLSQSQEINLSVDNYPVRLANLSGRALAGSGVATMTAGVTVRSEQQVALPLLIRGVGPGLGAFGIRNPLPNPAIDIVDPTGQVMANNDNWGDSGEYELIRASSLSVGAFSLPETSLDAAIHRDSPTEQFTIQITDQLGESGVGLLEVYRADDEATNNASQLINLSLRAYTGNESQVAIVGFVIEDPLGFGRPLRILLRAVGPSLQSFGVNLPLADPVLTLFDQSGKAIRVIDNWGESENREMLDTISTQVGAFTLSPDSNDAAEVLDLPPGVYTVSTDGKHGEEGVVLVEIYAADL